MSSHETLTVRLPADLVGRVRRAVAAGEYGSADDAISDALLAWEDRRGPLGFAPEDLRMLVEEGLASGPSTLASMDDVKAEARRTWASRGE